MPGFNIGAAGSGAKANVEIRRKHRWAFTAQGMSGKSTIYLQKATRPSFKLEEPTMHHDQEVAYFAGKQTWDPIALTFYDVESQPDVSADIWKWITTVVNIGSATVSSPSSYKKSATLTMNSASGSKNEAWALKNAWPKEVNWQDVDYTNTELMQIDVQMRFDRAKRS